MKSFTVGLVVATSAALVSADSSCTLAIGKAVSPLFTSADAKACAKAIGGTDMTAVFTTTTSSSDQAKLLASADCEKWYNSIATAIKGVSPPCTYIVNDSPVYSTDKFSWTFKEFLVKNNEAGENNAKSTPAPTTTAKLTPQPTNATNATTTKSPDIVTTPAATTKAVSTPTPSVTSAATSSGAALAALTVALYLVN
ncbi:hypothetical protein DYB32_006737 [Aphanomyces invadans]|uniref:Secreted protein n=1 Tax=Aphanomyces invadans TaxID=157072 RepID=A0A418AQT6_9STRA|nr:hypothetical protein DYB32_006737 [Aphanomyces invadans]